MRKLTTAEAGQLRYVLMVVARDGHKEGSIRIGVIDTAMVDVARTLGLELPETDFSSTLMNEKDPNRS